MSHADPADVGGDPAAEPANAQPGQVPTVGSRDGGVSRRVSRRCRAAASAALFAAGACLLAVMVRPWDLLGGILVLLAAVGVLGAAVLVRRAMLWTAVASTGLHAADGQNATSGPPQPLSPTKPGSPVRRRIGAGVVPIHAAAGPQPGAGALVIHARADGITLAAGDRLLIWRAGQAGAVPIAVSAPTGRLDGGGAIVGSTVTGRFVLRRESDGEVFLGTTRLTDAW